METVQIPKNDQKMKQGNKISLLLSVAMFFTAFSSFSQTYVPGKLLKNGTYREGYYKTSPNRTKNDNYSTEGNYNPYTGKEGKVKRDYYYNESPKPHKSRKNEYGY